VKHTLSSVFFTLALFALTLAASTGVLLRFGIVMGMPGWASNFSAIRHAHSHLMYFGWVTMGLMVLIWHYLPQQTGRPLPKGVGVQMAVSAVLALLSFPAFWSNGYGLTQIGTIALPLGAMVSGLNGILWLVFAALYWRATWGLPTRPLTIQLWDWAIVLLCLAFSGALGFVGLVMGDKANIALQQIFLHLFLDLFAVGWFNLALLGVLWAWLGASAIPDHWLPTRSLALLLVPTFLLGVAPPLISPTLFWVAATTNLGAAILLAWHLSALWPHRGHLPMLARFGLLILGVHIVSALCVMWPGFWQWSAGTQLRIFFLHNFLLGWVSSGLLGMVAVTNRRLAGSINCTLTTLWISGVGLMLVALLGVGFSQVVPLRTADLLWAAAWSSIGPALVALWVLSQSLLANRSWAQTNRERAQMESSP